MNTSQFMDKQIMDLSNSQNNSYDSIDLMSNSEENNRHIAADDDGGRIKKEDIVPSYDFQPIRPIGTSSPPASFDSGNVNVAGARPWLSADSKPNTSPIRNYGSLDSVEPAKVILKEEHSSFDANMLSEIVDRTMKKYADTLLHTLDGVSARLSQLETRNRQLENSLDDLKVSVGNLHGSSDGKMRHLENILREVQTGVEVIKDKQEIMDTHLHLAKLQVSKNEQEVQNTPTLDTTQIASASAPQQYPPATHFPPPPNAPPPPPPQHHQFPANPNQFPANPQRDSYYPPPGQSPENTTPTPQYQIPPPQQIQPPPQQIQPPPQQQYQPPPPPQYSQPPLPLPPVTPEELPIPYMQSQNYQPPPHSASGPMPGQQFYGPGPGTNMYDRPGPYGPQLGPQSGPQIESYNYNNLNSQYSGGSPRKSQSQGYPQLPTAKLLPQALPTASTVPGPSGPGGPGRVPVDDVVDKVTNMGFPRDVVRATVRRLTENGQAVDLNVVLDKLMNDGEVQPPRGWFGR